MLLKLYDGHAIPIEDIKFIIPIPPNKKGYRADRQLIDNVKNNPDLGYVLDWTKGKARKSAIVTTYADGKFLIFLTSMTPGLIISRIDEHQGVTRRHNGGDFTKADLNRDEKKEA